VKQLEFIAYYMKDFREILNGLKTKIRAGAGEDDSEDYD